MASSPNQKLLLNNNDWNGRASCTLSRAQSHSATDATLRSQRSLQSLSIPYRAEDKVSASLTSSLLFSPPSRTTTVLFHLFYFLSLFSSHCGFAFSLLYLFLFKRMSASRLRPAIGKSASVAITCRNASARRFSTRPSLQQEIRDAYILSASRTPTAKVSLDLLFTLKHHPSLTTGLVQWLLHNSAGSQAWRCSNQVRH